MTTFIEEAFERICRMKLPVCFDDVLVEVDPNTFRVPMVLDELASSEERAPTGICGMLGLEPGATFRQAVERYRLSIAPPTPQPSPQTRVIYVSKQRGKKQCRPRLRPRLRLLDVLDDLRYDVDVA